MLTEPLAGIYSYCSPIIVGKTEVQMGKQRPSNLFKASRRFKFKWVLFPEHQAISINHLGWMGTDEAPV